MTITTVRTSVLALAFAFLFVVSPSVVSASGENLIPNPGFESGNTGWTNDVLQGNAASGATFTLSSTTSTGTGSSAQVSITTYVSGTDAKWYFLPQVAATSTAQYYTFTDKYKSATTTSVFLYLSNGTIQWLGDGSNSNTWQTFSAEFLVPANVTFTIGHVLQSAGTLNTDDYSLVRSPAVPSFPYGIVTLSFDDGWDTYYANAFPILVSSTTQMKNTAYIISQANVTDPVDYMSNAQIMTIAASPVVEIGSHTRNHLDLVKDYATNPIDMQNSYGYMSQTALLTGELNGAKSDLEALIGKAVSSFAYPYGSYVTADNSVKNAVIAAGYTSARSVDQGYNLTSTDSFALKQQHITNTTTLAEAKGWIDTALASKSWLIFMFHDVRPNLEACVDRERKDVADQDCTDTTLLQGIVDYLKTKEVAQPGTVVTIAEGMALKTANAIPVIAPHADVFAEAIASTSAIVTYTNPTVTPAGTVTCTPASGSYFNLGSTTVICTSGVAQSTFVVGVRAHVAPVATNVATTTYIGVSTPITLVGAGTGTLTFSTTSNPKFGSLSGTGANLVYTPEVGTTTAYTDTFTFRVYDGLAYSNTATGTVVVTLAPDVTAPVIDPISAGTPGETTATITWTTNEAATSQVYFGTTTSYSATTTLDTNLVTAHSAAISGLTASTAYHYVVVSKDAAGNTATSTDQTFTTAATPAPTPAPSSGGGGGGGGGGGFIVPQTTGQVLGASTGLTEVQINAILDLLRSFGADQSVIDNVNKSLHGVGGSTASTGKYTFTKTLGLGSKNDDVTALQNLLTTLKFYSGPVTGTFGPLTSAGVKKYQAARSISQTGTVGPLTRAALNKE